MKTMLKIIAIVLASAALIVPAQAATYWVVLDTTSHKCSIVEQDEKPSSPTIRVIGNGYPNREIAENTIRITVHCGVRN